MIRKPWQRWGLVLATGGSLLALAWVLQPAATQRPPAADRPATAPRPALAALPATPFLNAAPDNAARYVGTQACVECHPDQHTTFASTGMGQSLARLNASEEPADAEFAHAASARRFSVYRRGDSAVMLHHREELLTEPEPEILDDHPVQYVVGSGRHSRSYLCEVDGFLVESPITWYTSKQAWSVSPGYDRAIHAGFRREAPEQCLFCHAGQAQAVSQTLHKMEILEAAIGCERCHGPGSLHVARRQAPVELPASDDNVDHTIVNPAHLSRDLADAVCHQCHLTSEAYVAARGRTMSDYRPGLPLEHFRHYYQSREAASSMRVVGHVDQMMLSRCYQEADTLRCTTCHNPHNFPTPDQKTQHYREKCLQCHQQEACRVSHQVREATSPQNDCVVCHMPTTDTDIPHMAFTHHRIGIHTTPSATEPVTRANGISQLEPLHDLSFLSETDRTRALGLAYAELSGSTPSAAAARVYHQRANKLLGQVHDAGLQDGAVNVALMQLVWPQDPVVATQYALDALPDPLLAASARVNALYAIAANHLQQQRPRQALGPLRQLILLRRNAADWALLGDSLVAINDIPAAVSAFERAVAIDPNLLEIQGLLAKHYTRVGDHDRAARQRKLLEVLARVHAQADQTAAH